MAGVMACGVVGVAAVSVVALAADPHPAALDGLKIAQAKSFEV